MSEALCKLDDIPDDGSARFTIRIGRKSKWVMAVRRGDQVVLYVDSCPHTGAPLDFTPGQFLNLERTHILCANHNALFQIDDGHCISGPCAGKDLEPVASEVRDGFVYLAG